MAQLSQTHLDSYVTVTGKTAPGWTVFHCVYALATVSPHRQAGKPAKKPDPNWSHTEETPHMLVNWLAETAAQFLPNI